MLKPGSSTAVATSSIGKSLKRRLRLGERIIEGWVFLAGLFAIIVLLGIIAILIKEGLPIFAYSSPWRFLFGTKWYPVSDPPTFGILPFFVSTLMVTLIATAVAVPIGVGCAAYLSEVAPPRIRETVKPIIELLAGRPPGVRGFFGVVLRFPPF